MSPIPSLLPPLSESQFTSISTLVKSLCGINLHDGKRDLVKARLAKRMRALDLECYDEYIDFVRRESTGNELVLMLDALSTNLTSFFREPDHFKHLASEVVPQIMARSAGSDGAKRVRIWSAGCSSGEEPYSIAMTLAGSLHPIRDWDVKILATDISTAMLARAAAGVYPQEKLQTLPSQMRGMHFACVETKPHRIYSANDDLKKLISFARLNLMTDWPMRGPFNAIFCRNVMIYFDKPTQSKLIERFERLLEPGGMLYIGHSESLANTAHGLRYVRPSVYRKPLS